MEKLVNIRLHKKNVFYTLNITGVDDDYDPQDEGIIALSNEYIKFIMGDPTATEPLKYRGDSIPPFRELVPISVQLNQVGLDACLWTLIFHLDFLDKENAPEGWEDKLVDGIKQATQNMLSLDEGTVCSPSSVNLIDDYLTIQFTVG